MKEKKLYIKSLRERESLKKLIEREIADFFKIFNWKWNGMKKKTASLFFAKTAAF